MHRGSDENEGSIAGVASFMECGHMLRTKVGERAYWVGSLVAWLERTYFKHGDSLSRLPNTWTPLVTFRNFMMCDPVCKKAAMALGKLKLPK